MNGEVRQPVAPAETGLIIGKFLPPHLGHQYLLDFGQAYVCDLTVLVCSLQREPIPGALRHQWVQEMAPRARVLHVTDENPSEPCEHPDFWRIWTDTIRRRMPSGPDIVFTSEDYGRPLAEHLGARHVIVDRARELVRVSGTKIRENPLGHWQYLPPPVRPHFVKRVAVIGPESTGKTTLCRQLAEAFQTVWVSEYARGYLDHKGQPFESSDAAAIMRGQLACEAALARQANRVLFSDTDLIMTMIYSRLYHDICPPWLEQAARCQVFDLHLLLDADVPWVADPQRDLPHRRREIFDLCRQQLDQWDRPYVVVRGSWPQRLDTALSVCQELLPSSTRTAAPGPGDPT